MKHLLFINKIVLLFSLLLFSLLNLPTEAADLKPSILTKNQNNKNIIAKIKKNDPTKALTNTLSRDIRNTNKTNVKQNNLNIEIDSNIQKITLKRPNKKDFKINLSTIQSTKDTQTPDLIDGKLIYNNQTTDTQTIVEAVDGGIRQIININSPNSPKSYKFTIDLELGDKLEINDDKSAIVKSVDKTTKIIILKPWAVDANGKNLKTWYNIDKNNPNTLIQHIDFEDAVFPVLADPTWCGNRYNSIGWINRNREWSASINVTWCGMYYSGTYETWNAWIEAYNKIPFNSAGWPSPMRFYGSESYWSTYNQFACHADYAGAIIKNPWNLEPLKPNKGYWGFVGTWCN